MSIIPQIYGDYILIKQMTAHEKQKSNKIKNLLQKLKTDKKIKQSDKRQWVLDDI